MAFSRLFQGANLTKLNISLLESLNVYKLGKKYGFHEMVKLSSENRKNLLH
jgi:hypothetical protein